jgi:hypothetical protein
MPTPKRNNSYSETCIPISSNCVDWEGGDLAGIKLCAEDSVSEVITKINNALNIVRNQLNLSELDISEILQQCNVCPEPQKTLIVILELLIKKIVSIEESLTPGDGSTDENLTIPTCLRVTNEDGVTITSLPIRDFVQMLSRYICNSVDSRLNSLLSKVNGLETTIDQINQELDNINPDLSISNITNNCLDLPQNAEGKIIVTEAFPILNAKVCEINTKLGGSALMTGSLAVKPFVNATDVKQIVTPTEVLTVGSS